MAKTRSFLSPGFVGATYQSKNTNKRATTTAKSTTAARTRTVVLPKAHSASVANLLALALVLSKSALISCQSFPCSLSYANLATYPLPQAALFAV